MVHWCKHLIEAMAVGWLDLKKEIIINKPKLFCSRFSYIPSIHFPFLKLQSYPSSKLKITVLEANTTITRALLHFVAL